MAVATEARRILVGWKVHPSARQSTWAARTRIAGGGGSLNGGGAVLPTRARRVLSGGDPPLASGSVCIYLADQLRK